MRNSTNNKEKPMKQLQLEDKHHWNYISQYQKLSEGFIREFKNRVNWSYISKYQKLSQKFIREFKGKVNWDNISKHQKLSKKFIKEFEDKVNNILHDVVHISKTKKQKIKEIKEYVKKHNLKFDGEFLYAFRNHDVYGRGNYNKTIFYKKGRYYKDWKCDMRKDCENSFGLGIWPNGNTLVKVSVDDWGVEVKKGIGKARVWGFTVLRKENK